MLRLRSPNTTYPGCDSRQLAKFIHRHSSTAAQVALRWWWWGVHDRPQAGHEQPQCTFVGKLPQPQGWLLSSTSGATGGHRPLQPEAGQDSPILVLLCWSRLDHPLRPSSSSYHPLRPLITSYHLIVVLLSPVAKAQIAPKAYNRTGSSGSESLYLPTAGFWPLGQGLGSAAWARTPNLKPHAASHESRRRRERRPESGGPRSDSDAPPAAPRAVA